MQSVEVKGAPEVPGEGKPRRNIRSAERLLEGLPNGASTLYENFKRGIEVGKDRPCFGRRKIENGVAGPYVWETYGQVHQHVLAVGSALTSKGFPKSAMIGVFSINRPEWVYTDLACNAYGFVSVPLYDTLGEEAIEFIINETQMSIIFSSNDKLGQLLKEISKYPSVKTVVLFDGATAEEVEKGKGANIDVISFARFEEVGKANPSEPSPVSPDEMVTIMYTSGTTGLPKGVMLSSKNILAVVASVLFLGENGLGVHVGKDDVHLSYLPLAHVFERMVMTYFLGVGGSVGFFQGSALKLLDDIAQLKPTLFPSVPRLLNRIYDRIIAAVELKGGISAVFFNMAVESKKAGLRDGYLTHWLWDRLVFGKVKERLGGRVKAMLTASAPISPEVLDFLRFAFCCEVHEAYGQTESCGGSSFTFTGDYESGNVGAPSPVNEIKLVDIPEMSYTSADKPYPRGEVCFRGPNVFIGYYNNEEKTKEAIDADGWLHSGDIGLWDEKGRLKIIDRKKNIFKLAQGEYIAPEKIENVYCKSKYVAQAFVYGDSLKAFLVAVLIPDEEVLSEWCKVNGVAGRLEDWCKDPKVKELVFKDIIRVGKELGLKSFEQVKEILLDANVFSIENNLLTPTFKLKRPQAKEFFQVQIDAMIEKVQKAEEEKEKKQNLEEEKKA